MRHSTTTVRGKEQKAKEDEQKKTLENLEATKRALEDANLRATQAESSAKALEVCFLYCFVCRYMCTMHARAIIFKFKPFDFEPLKMKQGINRLESDVFLKRTRLEKILTHYMGDRLC